MPGSAETLVQMEISQPFPNQQQPVSTQGGAYIGGNITASRDVIGRDKVVYGDEIGRDKIVHQSNLIIQQALSAVDEAQKAQAMEAELLARGINTYVQHLMAVATRNSSGPKGGPYRGLISYDLNDAEIFFGRDGAIAALGEHLRRSKLTIIQAESGAGKSSLLRAGVAPRLLTGGHLPLIVRPYDQSPTCKIKQMFLPNLVNTPELAKTSLRDFLQRVVKILSEDRELFIILDQFEEFFTFFKDTKERELFVSEFANCLEDITLNVRWVFSLRSEFFGALASFRPRVSNPFQNDFRLDRLTKEEAREVIVKPASLYQIEYESALVDKLLEDLIQLDDEVSPPQVQLVCLALYDSYCDQKRINANLLAIITQDLYSANGEARGILRNHLNRVLTRSLQRSDDREFARKILTVLISSDRQRLRCKHSDLARQLAIWMKDRQNLDHLLLELVDNRLVNVEQEENDPEAIYELAHDYLITELELDPQTQAQRLATEILQQEIIIQKQDQSQEQIIAKNRLEIIERYLPQEILSVEESALIRRSRTKLNQAEQSELNRVKQELSTQQQLFWRTRLLLGIVSAITFALAIQPIWGAISRYRAIHSVSMVYVAELGIAFEAYEVTNERYSWCVDYGDCNSPNNFAQLRNAWEQNKHKPVVNIDATDALNFCEWIGRTLPTAEQWLNVAPPLYQWKQLNADEALLGRTEGIAQLDEVGKRSVPQYQPSTKNDGKGIFDLVGSVYEWTKTAVVDNGKGNNLCINELQGESNAVVALGDAWNMALDAVGNYESGDVSSSQWLKSDRYEWLGFRCVSLGSTITEPGFCPSMEQ